MYLHRGIKPENCPKLYADISLSHQNRRTAARLSEPPKRSSGNDDDACRDVIATVVKDSKLQDAWPSDRHVDEKLHGPSGQLSFDSLPKYGY
jgi:hypothetical protein